VEAGGGAMKGRGTRTSTPGAAGRGLHARIRVERASFVLDAGLALAPGEVVAVLGANGSGKSTLLGALAGTVHVSEGSVELEGRLLSSPHAHVPPHERRMGLLGQDPRLFPHLTVLENVAFGPRALGDGARAARAEARVWLERVGLASFSARRPHELSGGQRQRVAIARALAARPRALLLDEPFASLDVAVVRDMRALLREVLAASGTSAIVVTHDAQDAVELASRAIVLDAGRVLREGAPTEALELHAERRAPGFVAEPAAQEIVDGESPLARRLFSAW